MVLESAGQIGHLFHYKSTSDLAIKMSNICIDAELSSALSSLHLSPSSSPFKTQNGASKSIKMQRCVANHFLKQYQLLQDKMCITPTLVYVND